MNLAYVHEQVQDIEADCILATICSNKHPSGRINCIIRKLAGNYYHEQVEEALTGRPIFLKNGDACITRYDNEDPPRSLLGPKDVIFVIDDMNLPLRDIVCNGLTHANDSRMYKSIILPIPRIEIALDEGDKKEIVKEMMRGVKKFRRRRPYEKPRLHDKRLLNDIMLVELNGDIEVIQLLKKVAFDFHRR
ncbi:MAG: hypothetical protein PHS95_03090 [Candidatus Pacebacteria bacterium]|nr:hypothetical protein [Candidatus Paceibacterota bacterium]